MKLIFCPECRDIVKLVTDKWRTCDCGKSGGRYLDDDLEAVYEGRAVPLGIDGPSFASAIKNSDAVLSENFEAFVIATNCSTFQPVSTMDREDGKGDALGRSTPDRSGATRGDENQGVSCRRGDEGNQSDHHGNAHRGHYPAHNPALFDSLRQGVRP